MTRRHRVAVLVLPGVSTFELAVPCEVFGIDRSHLGVPWYRFSLVSLSPSPVRTSLGFTIGTEDDVKLLRRADTIVVPACEGWRQSQRRSDDQVAPELQRAHARGARIMALCTGAFVLAEAGLLDGRPATTHWMCAAELADQYPTVEVDPEVLYVDDGDILTSAGTAAGIDLCLHVVRQDFGAEVANAVARDMVVPPHRDGGQAQYIERPLPPVDGDGLLPALLPWLEANLDQDLTVAAMAERCAMSPRTFARRFREATGTTPHRWILEQRLLHAQRLLEGSEHPVERVAALSGFGTAANLRQHFRRATGTTPVDYRRTFSTTQRATAETSPAAPGRS